MLLTLLNTIRLMIVLSVYQPSDFHGSSTRAFQLTLTITIVSLQHLELLQSQRQDSNLQSTEYKSDAFPLCYAGLAGRLALGRIFRCYGSFFVFEKRIFVTQRTPQLKLCKLMVRLELTITVLQTVPLTSWVHEQVPTIAAAVHDSLLWTSYGGMGEVGLEPTVFLRE